MKNNRTNRKLSLIRWKNSKRLSKAYDDDKWIAWCKLPGTKPVIGSFWWKQIESGNKNDAGRRKHNLAQKRKSRKWRYANGFKREKRFHLVSTRTKTWIVREYSHKLNTGRGKDPIISISGGHGSITELKAKLGMPSNPCVICGNIFSTTYVEPTRTRLIENNHCFNCDFWLEQSKRTGKDRIIIDGKKYSIKANSDAAGFKGFGGREFKVRMLESGEVIETKNMWHQGDIPKHFRDIMPNNAEFVRE